MYPRLCTFAETDRVLSQFLASLRARLQRHPRWTRVAGVVLLVAIVVTLVVLAIGAALFAIFIPIAILLAIVAAPFLLISALT